MGEMVKLVCFSSRQPTWTFKGYVFDSAPNATIQNNALLLKAQIPYSGEYICSGTHPNGTEFTATATVFVGCKLTVF